MYHVSVCAVLAVIAIVDIDMGPAQYFWARISVLTGGNLAVYG
jgi:hypothetical protein